jgi:hypothetical protein
MISCLVARVSLAAPATQTTAARRRSLWGYAAQPHASLRVGVHQVAVQEVAGDLPVVTPLARGEHRLPARGHRPPVVLFQGLPGPLQVLDDDLGLLAGRAGQSADGVGHPAVEHRIVREEEGPDARGRGLDIGFARHLSLEVVEHGTVDNRGDELDGRSDGRQVLSSGGLTGEDALGTVAELVEGEPPSADLAGRHGHAAHRGRRAASRAEPCACTLVADPGQEETGKAQRLYELAKGAWTDGRRWNCRRTSRSWSAGIPTRSPRRWSTRRSSPHSEATTPAWRCSRR